MKCNTYLRRSMRGKKIFLLWWRGQRWYHTAIKPQLEQKHMQRSAFHLLQSVCLMLFTPFLEACLLKICTFHYYKVRAPEHILVTHQSSNFCHQTLWKTVASSPSHFRKGKSQGFTSKGRFQSTVNPHHLWIPRLRICLHATIDL